MSSLEPRTFVVRWDLDAKGAWDFPQNGSFTPNPIALKTLSGPAPFRVILQIKDHAGLTSKAVAEIPITPIFKIVSIWAPDTVLAGRPFVAECGTSYPASAVGEFDWDFTGKKAFDVRQEKPSLPHQFQSAGIYVISCRAVARNGNEAIASKTIVAVARSLSVKALLPTLAQATAPVVFDAKIEAKHASVEQIKLGLRRRRRIRLVVQGIAQGKTHICKAGNVSPRYSRCHH